MANPLSKSSSWRYRSGILHGDLVFVLTYFQNVLGLFFTSWAIASRSSSGLFWWVWIPCFAVLHIQYIFVQIVFPCSVAMLYVSFWWPEQCPCHNFSCTYIPIPQFSYEYISHIVQIVFQWRLQRSIRSSCSSQYCSALLSYFYSPPCYGFEKITTRHLMYMFNRRKIGPETYRQTLKTFIIQDNRITNTRQR